MKVLINAYACSPYQGSEPGMGWNFISNLSHLHELHIITECKYILEFEQYFEEHPEEKKYYHFYFIKRVRLNFLRKIWPPSYYWTYSAWQKKALKKAKELDEVEHFDIVHQLNMVGFREPGYLYKLKKPLVWGPIGGMHMTPWCLLPSLELYGIIYYGLRNILNYYDMHFSLAPRRMAQKSNAIIAATQDAFDAVHQLWDRDAIIIPEVGMLSCDNTNQKGKHQGDKMKIAWSGNHTPSKALHLLIEALPYCKNKDSIEIHVLGNGIYTKKWMKKVEKLGFSNSFIWHGRIPRNNAILVMQSCDVFCITSLADLTSTVLLEAFSNGLPVIALDLFGFSNSITNSCGIKIKVTSKKQILMDYAHAIDILYEDESYRLSLAEGALKRAQDFRWDKKAEMIDKIYHDIVASSKQ